MDTIVREAITPNIQVLVEEVGIGSYTYGTISGYDSDLRPYILPDSTQVEFLWEEDVHPTIQDLEDDLPDTVEFLHHYDGVDTPAGIPLQGGTLPVKATLTAKVLSPVDHFIKATYVWQQGD
jgi:hypothetical protein